MKAPPSWQHFPFFSPLILYIHSNMWYFKSIKMLKKLLTTWLLKSSQSGQNKFNKCLLSWTVYVSQNILHLKPKSKPLICMFSGLDRGLAQLNLQTCLLTRVEVAVKASAMETVCCGFLKVGEPLTWPKVGQVKNNIWPMLTKLCYCIWGKHGPLLVV